MGFNGKLIQRDRTEEYYLELINLMDALRLYDLDSQIKSYDVPYKTIDGGLRIDFTLRSLLSVKIQIQIKRISCIYITKYSLQTSILVRQFADEYLISLTTDECRYFLVRRIHQLDLRLRNKESK